MPNTETRHLFAESNFETRERDGQPVIEGFFAVFGSEYRIAPDLVERIDPRAFHLERDTDVRALVNHNTDLVVGRTKAGTLRLEVRPQGLWGSVDVNVNDTDAMNAYERVRRGDVSQCSFGFNVLADKWEDGEPMVRTLLDVELWEVSLCTFPAYTDTEITARSAEQRAVLDSKAAEERRRAAEWRQAMRARVSAGKEAADA